MLLAVTAVLALSLKEEMALVYLVLGLLLVYQGRRRLGAILAAGSAACFVVGMLIIRSLGDSDEWFGRRFAGDRGDSFLDAFSYMLRHPVETLGDVLGHSGFDLARSTAVDGRTRAPRARRGCYWACRRRSTTSLSAYGPQHDLIHHYHLPVLTAAFIAAAMGVRRLDSVGRWARRFVAVGVAAAVAAAVVGNVSQHSFSGRPNADERAEIRRALAHIPPDAPVAAAPVLLPHLSHRERDLHPPGAVRPSRLGEPDHG